MPIFLDLASKARQNPLGPNFLGQLSNNLSWLRYFMGQEHKASGEHNVMRVPRGVFSMDWSGAVYSANPGSPKVFSSVSNPAVGTIQLGLDSARLDGSTDLRVQLNFKGTGVATKPWTLAYQVVDAVTLKIYLKQLSSALGAGNAWAAADGGFDIAIHNGPISRGNWSASPATHLRGDTLTEGVADWNALVQAEGDMFAALKAGHTSAGVHNIREVAKAYANIAWTGATYARVAGGFSSNVTSVSRTSTGIAVVTYSSMTTPTQCFVCPDYQRTTGGDPALYIMQAAQTSATQSTIYIYKYDTVAKTWNVADADFFIAVHGG